MMGQSGSKVCVYWAPQKFGASHKRKIWGALASENKCYETPGSPQQLVVRSSRALNGIVFDLK
jgi:hypothetical protein